jgi:hypothetical protein
MHDHPANVPSSAIGVAALRKVFPNVRGISGLHLLPPPFRSMFKFHATAFIDEQSDPRAELQTLHHVWCGVETGL